MGPHRRTPGDSRGITGALGGIANIAQLVALLKPHFAPASLVQPPLSSSDSSGRVVNNVTQNDVLTFKAGTLQWAFPIAYNAAVPVITYGVFGPPVGTAAIYIAALTKTSVTLKSTNASDARQVHITATGQPN